MTTTKLALILLGLMAVTAIAVAITLKIGIPRLTTLTGSKLKQCIQGGLYGVSSNVPSRLQPTIDSAFSFWNEDQHAHLLKSVGIVEWTADDPMAGGIILVATDNSVENPTARLKYNEEGCIIHAAILLPSWTYELPDKDILKIMKHEIGHCLGFDHSYGVMANTIYAGAE